MEGIFERIFQRFGDNKIHHKFPSKNFSGVENHLDAFCEQNLYMRSDRLACEILPIQILER